MSRLLRAFAADRLAACAAGVLALLLCAALFAPTLSPQNPYDLAQLNVLDARLPPGSTASDTGMRHLLGTDEQGRDMLSAMLHGLRISLTVGIAATLIALTAGLLLGLIAGYAGGKIDALIMRIADIQLSFPPVLLALVLLALSGPGIGKIIVALAAVQWAYFARIARATAMVERRKEYITAAIGMGLPAHAILLRHLLPNCLPPLAAVAALQAAAAISLEATLSFLGLGLPVTEPSLGLLIANGFQYLIAGKIWISVYPGVLLLVTVAAINIVADRLGGLLDPRLDTARARDERYKY